MKTLVAFLMCSVAVADNCHTKQVQVVQQVVYEQAAIIAVPIIYQVAPEIRAQALQYKTDPLYREFLKFKAGKEQKIPSADVKLPTPPKGVSASILATSCGKCHSGEDPAGGFAFNGKFRLEPDKFEKVVLWLSGAAKPPGKMAEIIDTIRSSKDKHVALFESLAKLQATKFEPRKKEEEE